MYINSAVYCLHIGKIMSYFHDTVYSKVYQAVISGSMDVVRYSEGVQQNVFFFSDTEEIQEH